MVESIKWEEILQQLTRISDGIIEILFSECGSSTKNRENKHKNNSYHNYYLYFR